MFSGHCLPTQVGRQCPMLEDYNTNIHNEEDETTLIVKVWLQAKETESLADPASNSKEDPH